MFLSKQNLGVLALGALLTSVACSDEPTESPTDGLSTSPTEAVSDPTATQVSSTPTSTGVFGTPTPSSETDAQTPTSESSSPTIVPVSPTPVDQTPTFGSVTATADGSTATADGSTPTPTAVAATPTAIPETPTAVPATPTAIPETPTAVSATPTAIPETPTAVPATPTAIPETPTAIPETPTIQPTPTAETDADADGYPASVDCNDGDAQVNPGAEEIPYDGQDNDCDASTLDDDLDEDGYGQGEDCDDANEGVNPGASEVTCNGVDEDCSAQSQDAPDNDGDGFDICETNGGGDAFAEDCNDRDAAINPSADEVCDGVDNDCDGTSDNASETLGEAALCAADSCAEIQQVVENSGSGEYWVQLEGQNFQVFCDMVTEGGGWTIFHPDDLGDLQANLQDFRTDQDHALIYLLGGDGQQYTTYVEELADFAEDYSPTFEEISNETYSGVSDPVVLRLTFVPRPDANVSGQVQGFRSNDQDLTFTNCDANGNSYIEWWRTDYSYDFISDYKMSYQWRDSKIGAVQTVPADYFTFTAMHFGGCGTHSTSPAWSAYDGMVGSIAALR